MKNNTKTKLTIFLILGGLFTLFNFTAFLYHDKAETVYLIVRFIFYTLLSAATVILKHIYHIEIERPRKEINYLWLVPFILPCLATIFYGFLTNAPFNPTGFEHDFFLEIGIEICGVLAEDLIFIDFAIDILLDILPERKHKSLLASFIAAVVFVIVRCSYFTLYSWDLSLFLLTLVFAINFSCGYLAIFFDSALIPICCHFFFNTTNLVIGPEIYSINYDSRYFVFMILVEVIMTIYTFALYRISRLMEFKEDFLEMQKSEEIEDIKN